MTDHILHDPVAVALQIGNAMAAAVWGPRGELRRPITQNTIAAARAAQRAEREATGLRIRDDGQVQR